MITIDLDKTYRLTASIVDPKISMAEFYAGQVKGDDVLMRVTITPYPDPLLPNVYNLAMGPPIGDEDINDRIRLKHSDSSRVFSTVILFALIFLTKYPEKAIGLDGSDDLRAMLYHSMFIVNRSTMDKHFATIGVDWYIKLLRNQMDYERTPDGELLHKPRPEKFDYHRTRADLYRYLYIEAKEVVNSGMDKKLREKMDEILKLSEKTKAEGKMPRNITPRRPDSLSTVIRTQKDADEFMAAVWAIANKKD